MKKMLTGAACAMALGAPAFAQMQFNFDGVELVSRHVAGSVHMIYSEGAFSGGNVSASIGDDGVLLIDDKFAPLGDDIDAALDELTDGPVRYLLNTHNHPDHVGGNAHFGRQGAVIVAHEKARAALAAGGPRPPIDEVSLPEWPYPPEALPVFTFADHMSAHVNGEQVDFFFVGPAHTDNDVVAFFRGSNVVVMGDVLTLDSFPIIFGDVRGYVAAQTKVLELIEEHGEDVLIVPGHGEAIITAAELAEYRDMVVTIYERVESLIAEGKTVDEVIAADVTAEWNDLYYEAEGLSSTPNFLRRVYAALAAEAAATAD